MTPVITPTATPAAERFPHRAARRGHLPDRLVRTVGRLPLRGRTATRRLVRQCRSAARSGDADRLLDAWCTLRHAHRMNLVRHALPVPVGVLATVGYGGAALGQGPRVPVLVAGTAAVASAALTALTALVTYVQAAVHAGLRRQLLAAGARPARPLPARPRPDRSAVPPRDDVVTRRLVAAAVLLAPPGAALCVVHATHLLTR